MGHSATYFCQFCTCISTDMKLYELDPEKARDGLQVREQARTWRAQPSKAARGREEQKNGVRWSAIHVLPYWNPVKHVVLGYMHNWLEGVLEEHQRTFWGIGRDLWRQNIAKEVDAEERFSDMDIEESGSELDELREEQEAFEKKKEKAEQEKRRRKKQPQQEEGEVQEGGSTPRRRVTRSSAQGRQREEGEEQGEESTPRQRATRNSQRGRQGDSTTPTQATFSAQVEDESGDLYEFVKVPAGAYRVPLNFLNIIRKAINDVSLPTWISQPPRNLGEASHGRLKAEEYQNLFAYIFPLIMPELWTKPDATAADRLHLINFHHLVVCTNIVCSFRTSRTDADLYERFYYEYRKGIAELYTYWEPLPNHHWALHNGEFLRNWGPLPPLSEFFGERLVGLLQDINTNQRTCKC